MAKRIAPPKNCVMCGSNDRLMLQYKAGEDPWADALFDEKQQHWVIVKRAEHLRWLCSACWRQNRGIQLFGFKYPAYKRARKR